jgi:N-acetylglucosamine-6-phosphate deacetylase
MSESIPQAVTAAHVFDGAVVHEDAAVVIEGVAIRAVMPRSELPGDIPVRAFPDSIWLAPGFIDLQVNGGADILFNDAPTVESIAAIAAAHRRFGTTALLPTFISDTPEKMQAAIEAVQASLDAQPSVLGIHLEGPFLSPLKAGVHDLRALRAPSAADRARLTSTRRGEMLMTLAPEQVPQGFVAQLTQAGIHVALGHSMATYAQTRQAMADGITGFTHLFNAMRPLASREPGPIAAALESPDAWFSLIVDGVHVDPAMLRLALRGAGHPVLVTDAMPPVGGRRSSFDLYDQVITVEGGRCARPDGTLAGAVLDMASAVRNCVRLLELPLAQALCFASTNPANAIGLGNVLGRLAPGYRADLVAVDASRVEVVETWVAGA